MIREVDFSIFLDKLDAMESKFRQLRRQSEAEEEVPDELVLSEAARVLAIKILSG